MVVMVIITVATAIQSDGDKELDTGSNDNLLKEAKPKHLNSAYEVASSHNSFASTSAVQPTLPGGGDEQKKVTATSDDEYVTLKEGGCCGIGQRNGNTVKLMTKKEFDDERTNPHAIIWKM